MLNFARWKIIAIIATCSLFTLMALPNLFAPAQLAKFPGWLPSRTVNLGLDLRGGSYLLLEVDFSAFWKDQMANLADDVRSKLREKQLGYRGLSAKDNTVVVEARDPAQIEAMKAELHAVDPRLSITQPAPGQFVLQYDELAQREAKQRILDQSVEIINRRVNETGTKEPIIQREGLERIVLQVPGLENPEHLKEILGRTAKMTFHLLDESLTPEEVARGVAPQGVEFVPGDKELPGQPAPVYPIRTKVEVSGDALVDAHTSYDEMNEPVVAFRFNQTGARKFGDTTSQNIGKRFAVVLDGKVVTAPVIRSAILGGSGIISGSFTVESANDLALLLRAGALPAPLRVVEERSVGPSLGSDSIAAGKLASTIGIGLVILFMLLFYGLFGLFANIAMIINAIMTLALLSLFQATLTLPGIAGIVLTVGMAVDANVLIYERMREETRLGKTPFAAVESGFRMAFGTIIDSHITTLSAALILYYFGTGTVKGFAVTLAIGIICSLFTAVLVTRLMVATWMKRVKPKQLPI